jgi:uncharacterized damage-inducible protein DinB
MSRPSTAILRLRASAIPLFALLTGAGPGARAATAQGVPNREAAIEVRKQYLADLDGLRGKFLALAEAFPAEKYAWRPGPGVRSVGEVFMHVADELYTWAVTSYGATPSPVIGTGPDADQKFEAKSTKPEVLKHLREGAQYSARTLNAIDPAAITGTRKIFGRDRTIIETSFGMIDDLHEHLGQLIAYARMNGVKPPWSK